MNIVVHKAFLGIPLDIIGLLDQRIQTVLGRILMGKRIGKRIY